MMDKKIMTVQDAQNAVTLEIVGANVVLTSRHKWENTRKYVSVSIDRDAARLLAKAIWRACNICNDQAELIGVEYHDDAFKPEPIDTSAIDGDIPDYLMER